MRRPSASRAIFWPLAIPVFSTGWAGRPKPAISTRWKTIPSRISRSLRKSRVVPGKGVTMARSSWRSALNRVDFPTFVRPVMASVTPSLIRSPGRLEALDQPPDLAGQGGKGASVGRGARPELFLGEFQAGLDPGEDRDELAAEPVDPARQASPELAGGDPGLGQGDRPDEVVDRLGLDDIQAPVEVGPQGEFSRPGQPGPGTRPEIEDGLEDGRAAVDAQLDDVLPGIGPGRLEIGQESLVEARPAPRIPDRPEHGPPHREGFRRAGSSARRSARRPRAPSGRLSGRCPARRSPAASRWL